MKKILVTGASGFIGSHLVQLLIKRGHSVTAFVRYDSRGIYSNLSEVADNDLIKLHRGDIRDYDSVVKAIEGCDTIFHLAALIGIPYSYESPLAYIKTNVEGTYNILEAARQRNCLNVLVTSTSETYGTAQFTPIDETHPAVGQSPYAASKIGADQLALSYYRSFGLPVKVVRPFNTYGPRQSARAIIPTVISQIASGQKNLTLGNLDPTRDLTFVTDTAEGMIAAALSDSCIGRAVNLGVGKEISIRDLVYKIAELMDTEITITNDTKRARPNMSEVERLISSNKLMLELTGWKPNYSLENGLIETIAWIRDNITQFNAIKYST
jgi:NAD dependent epimerase/dehydratase